jgi:hypothetical protein
MQDVILHTHILCISSFFGQYDSCSGSFISYEACICRELKSIPLAVQLYTLFCTRVSKKWPPAPKHRIFLQHLLIRSRKFFLEYWHLCISSSISGLRYILSWRQRFVHFKVILWPLHIHKDSVVISTVMDFMMCWISCHSFSSHNLFFVSN